MGAAEDTEAFRAIIREELNAFEQRLTPHRLLTPEELAEFLQVEKETVHTYVSRDNLPCVKLGPKLLRFDLADVIRWARERGRNLQTPPEAPRPRHLRALKGK